MFFSSVKLVLFCVARLLPSSCRWRSAPWWETAASWRGAAAADRSTGQTLSCGETDTLEAHHPPLPCPASALAQPPLAPLHGPGLAAAFAGALHEQLGAQCQERQRRSWGSALRGHTGWGDVCCPVRLCGAGQWLGEVLRSCFAHHWCSDSQAAPSCSVPWNEMPPVQPMELRRSRGWFRGRAWAAASQNLPLFFFLKTELWLSEERPNFFPWGFCDSSHFLSLQPSSSYKNLSGGMVNQLLLLWLNLALSRSVILKEERQKLVPPW